MTRTYAAWADPIAQQLTQSRADVQQAVGQVPESKWAAPSGYINLSYKDQLAHLAGSHAGVQGVLTAIIAGEPPDFSRFDRIDQINEEHRQANLDTAVDALLAEYLVESDRTLDLISQLTPEQAEYDLGQFKLAQALQGFAMHDQEHLAQVRGARVSTTFAAWVEPIAARFDSTRRDIDVIAAGIRGSDWNTDSTVPGWTYRDILAHLGEGNFFCRAVIQAVLDDSDTDMRTFSALKEQRIENALNRGRELTIDALRQRAKQDGEDMRQLLARLTPEDEERLVITSRTNPEPTTLGMFLSGYHHDEEHLAQLRVALTETSTVR